MVFDFDYATYKSIGLNLFSLSVSFQILNNNISNWKYNDLEYLNSKYLGKLYLYYIELSFILVFIVPDTRMHLFEVCLFN